MKLNITHIAKLANLNLTSTEESKLQSQLEDTLETISNLNEINTDKTIETSQVTGLENVLDEDEVEPSLTQKDALMNTKKTHNGYFVVDSILDN